jgi:hypothetical protein
LKEQQMPRSVGIVLKMAAQGTFFPFQAQYLKSDLEQKTFNPP